MATIIDEHKRAHSRVHARIGLLGNPSDQCHGNAVALCMTNFYCEAHCEACEGIELVPHAVHDSSCFADLSSLEEHTNRHGYYGGLRLLQATCKMFIGQCRARGVDLPQKGFKLSYDTTIPRQAGLSGSSAIITAAFNCLLEWYNVPTKVFPIEERPTLVLSVEEELGITAGLMDRVAQVYGGAVYMDLGKEALEQGHGNYEYLPSENVPPLWLIHASNPSDSGKVHAPVKQRWLNKDRDVVAGMKELGDIALTGRNSIANGDVDLTEFAKLMNRNFNLRRQMYGDAALGAINIDMVETATKVGAAAKFCGSGGAVVALCPEGETQATNLIDACLEKGYICEKVEIAARNF